MKRFISLLTLILITFMITACQSTDSTADEGNSEGENVEVTDENGQEEEADETAQGTGEPIEPDEHAECEFCQMKIYGKDEEMGVFTAQAVTKDGKNIFFDDSGCLLNYDRENEGTIEKQWVRDYVTKEWISKEEAVPVETNIQSPMKYGYVFLDSETKAEEFVAENSEFEPSIATWETIDEIANKRLEQKKQKMQEEGHDHNHEHDHDHEHDHHDH